MNQATTPLAQWLPEGKTLADVAAALEQQVARDFQPHWGISARVVAAAGSVADAGCWSLMVLDDADQAGALGYHDTDQAGNPVLKVFARDALSAGEIVSVDLSHELLETLVDPFCNLCAQDASGRVWAYEVCDAVEQQTYDIGGVTVSNFVLAEFFMARPAGAPPVALDFLGRLTRPFEIASGGYLSFSHAGRWHQQFGGAASGMRLKHRALVRRAWPRARSIGCGS
ncbi:MAG TPA: hypothetical protein VFW87_09555 [Pirellulales bacterium]|nr:hypothetical protein [Pirellulales bacterium]